MIRISTSNLVSYQYFKNNEDSKIEDLIADLTRGIEPTPQMLAGRAFAKFMEHAREQDVESAEVDGWTFHFDLDAEMPISPIRELKAEVIYQTPYGPVTLVGMVDGMYGLTICDQKLSERFDPEKYLDSLQWKVYLTIFKAVKFRYDVFVGKYDGQHVAITDYHPTTFFRYPGMEDDVRRAVEELAQIIHEYMPVVEAEAQRAQEAR